VQFGDGAIDTRCEAEVIGIDDEANWHRGSRLMLAAARCFDLLLVRRRVN
jgi:hypothetical protein